MNFIGYASFWLQSMQSSVKSMTWAELGAALCARFDRDEQNHLTRQFFRIKQTASVIEYIETFSDLVHQLLAHDPTLTSSVITNRFIDGLQSDIRSVVIVHRPQDLDAASSLALLQEEVSMDNPRKEYKKLESNPYSRKISPEVQKSTGSLMPHFPTKPPAASLTEDKRNHDYVKTKSGEDKLLALKAFRRSKGLCYKCGEKWGPTHNCPPICVSQCY